MFDSISDPARQWWQGQSDRDRAALSLLAIALLIAVVVFGLITPVYKLKQSRLSELDSAQETYRQLQDLAPLALAQGSQPSQQATTDLNSEIRRQAARNGFEIQRFEPSGEGLRVWIEDVRFNSVVLWLGALEQKSISHSELTMEDRATAGLVSARVTLYGRN